jgi:hypothetical protein
MTRSGRVPLSPTRRPTRSFIDAVPPTAPVRRHGCQLDPRLELDSIWWPRPFEARGTWRRSRSGGQTERCRSGAFAGRRDVCLVSERSIEWRTSGQGRTRRVDLTSNCVLKCRCFPLANVDGPLHRVPYDESRYLAEMKCDEGD